MVLKYLFLYYHLQRDFHYLKKDLNLYKHYFEKLLTFKAKDNIKHYKSQIKDEEILTFLNQLDEGKNFYGTCNFIKSIKNNGGT